MQLQLGSSGPHSLLLINCHLCLAPRRGLRSGRTYSFVGHQASCTALLSCHACYRSTPAMIRLPTVSPPETAQRSGSYRGLPFRCAVLSSEWNKALWPAQVIYQLFFFPYPPYSFSDPLLTSLLGRRVGAKLSWKPVFGRLSWGELGDHRSLVYCRLESCSRPAQGEDDFTVCVGWAGDLGRG